MKEQLSEDELSIFFFLFKRHQDLELHSQLFCIQGFDCIHIDRNNIYLRLIVEKTEDVSDGVIKAKPGTVVFWKTGSKPYSAALRFSKDSRSYVYDDQPIHTWTSYFSKT